MSFIDYNRNPYCSAPACQQRRVAQELIENKRVTTAQVKNAAETFLENEPELAKNMRGKKSKQALTVSLVPSNNSPLTKLPEQRAAAFLMHLREIYKDVQTNTPDNHPTYVADIEPDDSPELKSLLGNACATCKGNCCRLGETHAFQDYWSLKRYLQTQAPLTEDELVSQFEAYLPEFSTNDACVFQGSKGCTLPENMRSITCNNHKCYPLIEFQRQITHQPNGIKAIGAVRGRNVDTIAVFTEKDFHYIEVN
jgi:hypothetical protein